MAKQELNDEDIIKYLGFDIHPGKVGEFWNSEDEKKRYLAEVKARGGKVGALDRDAALLNVKLMTKADRIIAFIGSFLLIISFFLPVYSFNVNGKQVSGSALSFFANISVAGGYASWGGFAMEFALFIFALIIIACPVVGVLNLIGLMNKHKGDEYFNTVKDYSRYVFVPIILYIILILVLLVGTPHPFGSLGVDAFGDQLSIASMFTMTGVGFWMNIAGIAIVFAERRGI